MTEPTPRTWSALRRRWTSLALLVVGLVLVGLMARAQPATAELVVVLGARSPRVAALRIELRPAEAPEGAEVAAYLEGRGGPRQLRQQVTVPEGRYRAQVRIVTAAGTAVFERTVAFEDGSSVTMDLSENIK